MPYRVFFQKNRVYFAVPADFNLIRKVFFRGAVSVVGKDAGEDKARKVAVGVAGGIQGIYGVRRSPRPFYIRARYGRSRVRKPDIHPCGKSGSAGDNPGGQKQHQPFFLARKHVRQIQDFARRDEAPALSEAPEVVRGRFQQRSRSFYQARASVVRLRLGARAELIRSLASAIFWSGVKKAHRMTILSAAPARNRIARMIVAINMVRSIPRRV